MEGATPTEANTEQALQDRVQRGQWARELLENPVWQETWDQYEKQLLAAFKALSPRDSKGMELAHQQLVFLERFKVQVTEAINSGKMAQVELNSRQTRFQRLQTAVGWNG